MFLILCEDWNKSMLAKTKNGKKVYDSVFSSVFWHSVDDCKHASQPLIQVLHLTHSDETNTHHNHFFRFCTLHMVTKKVLLLTEGDERPDLAEIAYAMNFAKVQIEKAFGSEKLAIRNKR